MIHPQRAHPRRAAFTLIEILVVIAIIAVLVALLVPAVMKIAGKGAVTQAQTEISQLDTAMQNFKTTMGPGYIPSRIKLCENVNSYGNTQLDQDSIAYLIALFPQILSPNPSTGVVQWSTTGIDWNGNGTIDKGFVILEGHQCLVFFLGGIPIQGASPGCFGWSTDPRDPAKMTQTTGRKGPFYEFPSNRLVDRGEINTAAGGTAAMGYYSFIDPYQKNMPYAYFSSYNTRNGYAKYPGATANTVLDNASLGVSPYFSATTPTTLFYNPTSYQIISAGADGAFGPGGPWTSATAGAMPKAGQDDQSNFNNGNLLVAGS